MKLQRIVVNNGDVVEGHRQAVIATILGYAKTYELLHKQLWRKDRVTLVDYSVVLDSGTYKPVRYWDIKSWSTAPYDKDSPYALGLNQLFMGQNYNSKYEGNPKDGIYHDTCLIRPKTTDIDGSVDMNGWYIPGAGRWEQTDKYGTEVISDVVAYTKDGLDGMWYSVTYVTGVVDEFVLEKYPAENGLVDGVMQYVIEYPDVWYGSLTATDNPSGVVATQTSPYPDLSEHGDIVYEDVVDGVVVRPTTSVTTNWRMIDSYAAGSGVSTTVRVYEDGTCVELVDPTIWVETGTVEGETFSIEHKVPGKLVYLPLVNTVTGDLLQSRTDFIEQWDDMFELQVEEDGYWYTNALPVLMIVVSIIVALVTGYILDFSELSMVLSIMGSTISTMGSMSGDKVFQALGAALGIAGVVNGIIEKGLEQQLVKNASTQSAKALSMDMEIGLSEMYGAFVSGAGLWNLTALGASTFQLYGVLATPDISDIEDVTEQEDLEDGGALEVYYTNIDEDAYDPMAVINGPISIV